MKILSIETSGRVCAVALSEDNNLIKEEIMNDENTHSVKLMPLVDKLLKQTGTQISDIDLFACDVGPGSFTGIRIGLSTVKAFMDVTNKKALGVSSLEILAENIENNKDIVCTLIDAKNKNLYYGFFKKENKRYEKILDFGFDTIDNVIQIAKYINKKIIFIGNGSTIYKDMIESKLENIEIISDDIKNNLNVRKLAFIAFKKQEEAVVESEKLVPLYLRKSSAEIQKQVNL